jgi:hypothetical protein
MYSGNDRLRVLPLHHHTIAEANQRPNSITSSRQSILAPRYTEMADPAMVGGAIADLELASLRRIFGLVLMRKLLRLKTDKG